MLQIDFFFLLFSIIFFTFKTFEKEKKECFNVNLNKGIFFFQTVGIQKIKMEVMEKKKHNIIS
jgi:hypothetical protein